MKIILTILALLLPVTAYATESGPSVKMVERETKEGVIEYPHLSGLKDAAVERKVNDDIIKQFADRKCDASEEDQNGIHNIYFNAVSEITQFTPKVLSFTVRLDYDCSGAYPDFYDRPITYDLKTGEVVELEDLLKPDRDSEKFGAFVMDNYKSEEQSCNDSFAGLTHNDFSFYLKPGAIVFIPNLNHASRVCEEPIEIPLEKIKPYLKAGTVLTK